MTVKEYIDKLQVTHDTLQDLCMCLDYDKQHPCRGCLLEKSEGKPCPVVQLNDVKRALEYAVQHGINCISEDTNVDCPAVITFLRRAVVLGYSIRTLRFCNEDYIKLRNLIEIPLVD